MSTHVRKSFKGRRLDEKDMAPPLTALTDAQSEMLWRFDYWNMPASVADSLLRGRQVESLSNSECVSLRARGRELFLECSRAWETLEEEV